MCLPIMSTKCLLKVFMQAKIHIKLSNCMDYLPLAKRASGLRKQKRRKNSKQPLSISLRPQTSPPSASPLILVLQTFGRLICAPASFFSASTKEGVGRPVDGCPCVASHSKSLVASLILLTASFSDTLRNAPYRRFVGDVLVLVGV